MLRTLIESNAPPQRRRASTAASVVIHTAIIGGAIVATASARPGERQEGVIPRDSIIYVDPSRQPLPRRESCCPVTHVPDAPQAPWIPPISIDPPPGLPRVPVDIDVQRLLGSEAVAERKLFDPRGPLGLDRGGGGSGEGEPATAATVDRPASLVAPPRPRYPEALRAAGVTGRVVVRFVVDTAGRVEPRNVAVLESSHDLFSEAVRAVLPSLRFRPAEVAGRKVRMLVDLPFEFRLNE